MPCHRCYINETWWSKGGGDFYGRPPSHKKLSGELTPQLVLLSYLPVSASFGVKRVMHYITFFVIKTLALRQLGKNQSLNQFFSSGSSFTLLIFFISLQITNERAFAFLNTAIIMFCLIYSLNIPHSITNPSFFFCG